MLSGFYKTDANEFLRVVEELFCRLAIQLPQPLSEKLAGMVFPKDLFWAHCCSMFILMISQVSLKI
jgi:hypothetical protein